MTELKAITSRMLVAGGIYTLVVGAALFAAWDNSYRYKCFLFNSYGANRPVATGVGRPQACAAVFYPGAYTGPTITIPPNAEMIGMLVLTHRQRLATVALWRWKDEDGRVIYGCNGPSPAFAIQAGSRVEMLGMIEKHIGQPEFRPLAMAAMD